MNKIGLDFDKKNRHKVLITEKRSRSTYFEKNRSNCLVSGQPDGHKPRKKYFWGPGRPGRDLGMIGILQCKNIDIDFFA